MRTLSPTFYVLSAIALVGAAVASLTTLLWAGAFPLPPEDAFNSALAEARGWSAVTLALAVPLLAGALVATFRGWLSGRLLTLGVLVYLLYTYLELAVSPPFTALYLVYIVTFATALPAIVLGITSIDTSAVAARYGERAPVRSIYVFCLTFALGLSLVWLNDVATRMIASDYGYLSGVTGIAHVVHALDLGLQVPLGLATAALLLRHKPGGYVLAALTLVNAALMGTALTAMVSVSLFAQGENVLGAAPFALLAVVAIVLAALFFRVPHIATRAGQNHPHALPHAV